MTKLIVTRRSGAYDLFAFCGGIFFSFLLLLLGWFRTLNPY